MVKALIAGVWACVVTIASIHFSSKWQKSSESITTDGPVYEFLKLKPITVPVVKDGAVEGYLLAVIGYNIDRSKLKIRADNLDPMLQDESFRTLYGVEALKYKKPRKSDLAEISKVLVDAVNQRAGSELAKEVLIEELSYIPKEKARAGRGG